MRRLPSATTGDPMSKAARASTWLPGSSLGRVVGIVFGATIGLVASCYSERVPPPTFRYPCDGASDCDDNEECVRGLCQIPCTQLTFQRDCPQDGTYLACFNGYCSNTCDPDGYECPGPHECITSDLLGGGGDDGSNPFGGGGGGDGSGQEIGICAQTCSSDRPCPEGEQCVGDTICLATCGSNSSICPSGQECVNGLCFPEGTLGGPPGGTESGSDTGEDDNGDLPEGTGTSAVTGGLTEGG